MKSDIKLNPKEEAIGKYLLVIVGATMYTLAQIYFVTPQALYTGGVMGCSQLFRTFLESKVDNEWIRNFDVAGVVYYAINIPLFIMAFKDISRNFFIKTLVATSLITILLSVIPSAGPVIEDKLTSCIVGGIMGGAGIGFMLRYGGSGGGLDILGVWMTKKYKDASVGKVALTINIILYVICAFAFGLETAVYSVIYCAVSSITLDRFHSQNIMIEAMIFTKAEGIPQAIMTGLGRGVTEWKGDGAYTHEEETILVTVISKYEMIALRRTVRELDPHAFITYNRIESVDGNFKKRL